MITAARLFQKANGVPCPLAMRAATSGVVEIEIRNHDQGIPTMKGDRIIFDFTNFRGLRVVLMWRRRDWLDGRHIHAYQIGPPAKPLKMKPDGRPRCFEVVHIFWLTLIHEVQDELCRFR